MRVIICGSPQWNYDQIVIDEVVKLRKLCRERAEKLLIITGGEVGPERAAETFCKKLGIDYMTQPAINVLGDSSYFRRNELMIKYHKPDLVIGIAHKIDENQVIYHLLQIAKMKDIRTKAIDYESLSKRHDELDADSPIGSYS
ncbi:MAG: hypothetical protein AAF462_11915 [Thermodesulfobacteriota bacterium]